MKDNGLIDFTYEVWALLLSSWRGSRSTAQFVKPYLACLSALQMRRDLAGRCISTTSPSEMAWPGEYGRK